ncbi:MAG TPA: hypothetical protein VJ953_10475 [Saprospiraceae bacterium]|nr:hypothetical protein [Saprospiraceae bacterium]
MKDLKKMKTLFTAILLFFAAQSFASLPGLPEIDIATVGVSKKVKVTIGNLKTDATIAISDSKGVVLISETIEKGTFGKIYNLELLPDGIYTVGVQTTLKEVEQPLLIKQGNIAINNEQRREQLLPFVKLDQKVVNVMMLNNRITDVTVMIKNDNGDLLLTENLGNVVKVEKSYNIAALDRGRYQVIIETPKRTFYREVIND